MRKTFLLVAILIFSSNCQNFKNDTTIVQAISSFPRGLDPVQHQSIDEYQIYSQIYETLLKLDSDYKTLLPNLADSWETSSDNKQFILHLKDNILFHDGSVLNAEDVKESINFQ